MNENGWGWLDWTLVRRREVEGRLYRPSNEDPTHVLLARCNNKTRRENTIQLGIFVNDVTLTYLGMYV